MDLISDFRDKNRILALSDLIKFESKMPMNIMEICGGHTHSIMKFGINQLVGENINFIHGPGCPVCVIPGSRIDEACKLARDENTIFCTLADMLRVKGSKYSLSQLRAEGSDIRALYTPLDALKIAVENKPKRVIFFAIGFETTAPMTALLIQKSIELKLKNIFFHINHVTVPAPIRAIMLDGRAKINAFLGPSHVSVIIGSNAFNDIAKEFKTPVAVSGFEPLDIMISVLNLVRQHKNGKFEVFNEYSRAVKPEGNLRAQKLVKYFFEPCSFCWRGLGEIKNSSLKLKDEFSSIDARVVFDCTVKSKNENKACICGEILRGLAKPYDCSVFGKKCTPKNPVGSCMVSSEGACAAYFKYARIKSEV